MLRRIVVLVAVAAVSAVLPAGASAWAPAPGAIHPGVMTYTEGSQCTANFVYSDGASTYLGQAAHCAGTGGNTETNGCTAPTLPTGTPVEVDGATRPGTLVYSSWVTMQANGESDPNVCQYNDIALIRLDPADVANVNPSVPYWGGPVGLSTAGLSTGEDVYSYGNSSLRLGISQLSPKRGVSVTEGGGGWTHTVYTVTPGIPGDSGSGFLTATGKAFGVLSTVALAPLPASNGVSDLAKMLDYMHAHGGPAATVVNGTQPFKPGLPIGG
jgi:hypothetical protein